MLDALDITEEEAQGLAELARHDLAMARSFAARAQAAEDAAEANDLARSYQRAARSYRQTLALKVRLKRDLAAAAQAQSNIPRPKPGGAAVARRIGELRKALLRLAWDEAERAETETDDAASDFSGTSPNAAPDVDAIVETFGYWEDEVGGIVAEACLKDDFCDTPLEDHVARLALDLGFSPEAIARWPDLADPPTSALNPDAADPFPRHSSA
jgi:hypothetical protein